MYTYIKICYIHIDLSVFNRGNLLNCLYHCLNLYENLPNLAVLVYTYIKICYIHIDLTVFNRGNLLNWLYHGLNLHENLQNLAALVLCAYIKVLLMAALIRTYYIHTSMKNTNNLQITTHTVQVCTFHDGCKQGIDQQILNRKSISRKITHPQS